MRASLLFICMLLATTLWAQQVEIEDRTHRHYNRLDLQEAIKRYQRILEREPENGELLFKLANAYRLNSQYDEAVTWFEKATKFNNTPNCTLYYAQVLLATGKFAQAGEWFQKYAGVAETPAGIKNANLLVEYCEQLAKHGVPADIYEIEKMPFNSGKLDFSPAFLGDKNKIIFSSTRNAAGKTSKLVDGWTAEGFVDLYFVQKDEQGNWLEPTLLPAPLNSKFHEGPLTFSQDYYRAYITRSDNNKGRGYDSENNTRLHIYSLDRSGDYQLSERKHWMNLQPLWFNNSEYSCAHPTLSKDGKIMVLSSDKPEGFGHMDLYVSFLEGDKWTEPKNLGDIINTTGTEAFPYLHPETNNLYFASNMHVGLGGLDIFKALWNSDTKTWEHPVNVGAPVNGADDDFGVVITEDLAEGFFTSNREREKEDEIYAFKRKLMVSIAGVVVNAETGERIPDADVTIISGLEPEGKVYATLKADANGAFSKEVPFNSDYLLIGSKDKFITTAEFNGQDKVFRYQFDGQSVVNTTLKLVPEACELFLVGRVLNENFNTSVPFAEVVVLDKCSGQSMTIKAGEDGSYRIPAKKDCDYELSATKEGFLPGKASVSTKGKSCTEGSISIDVILDFEKIYEGLVIELENIYFDFDKYFIRDDASADLEHIYKLLIEYPEMKGELGAHTDSRGAFEYNDRLSENRAKSAVEWLVKKGIAKDRLTWKGYGERQLRNECSDNVTCSKTAHQRNRRVEFKVTYFKGTVNSKERTEYVPSGEKAK